MPEARNSLEATNPSAETPLAADRPPAIRLPVLVLEDAARARPAGELEPAVTRIRDANAAEIEVLVSAYGARLVTLEPGREIPGSYWGESEAGLIENDVFVRADTPVHSLLHELCHYVCMDAARRAQLVTDAGGDDDEECAVCYLEVLLADELTSFGRDRCLADMDEWGYSFREGSAAQWFASDGQDARRWLLARGLIDASGRPTFKVRD
jgi:hypothetical protein